MPPQNNQPTDSQTSIYPSPNTLSQNPNPVQQVPQKNKGSKKSIWVVGVIVLLVIISSVTGYKEFANSNKHKPTTSSNVDIQTPSADFQEYNLKVSDSPNIHLFFYKNSSPGGGLFAQPPATDPPGTLYGNIMSPNLSGGRLPLQIYILQIKPLNQDGASAYTAKACIINSYGNSFAFSVPIDSLKTSANVCTGLRNRDGSPNSYSVNFSDDKYTYGLQFQIPTVSTAKTSQYNMNLYQSDIKRITGSIEIN